MTKRIATLFLVSFLGLGQITSANADMVAPRSNQSEQSRIQAEANLTILVFAKSRPPAIFERVRETMADAIEVNNDLTLQEAYVIAVCLHYNVTAENYRNLGISEREYQWLVTAQPGIHREFGPSSVSEKI